MATRWWLLHVDLDQFVAAVELLRRPELRGRPVVVGGSGDPTRARQVVATASYEARAHGVHSGMPLRAAARRCPDAVFLPSDPPAYEAASARVMAALRGFPVRVEVFGWDEAFVGAEVEDPMALAADLQKAVFAQTGLTCAVGVGDNKSTAKIAARFGKPGGVFQLTAGNWMDVMGARPAAELWGVGPKTAKKLADLGLHTVADLAAADPEPLLARFGARMAGWLRATARGGGDTEVVTEPWVARSRSRETTYPRDLTDPEQIAGQVAVLARELGADVVGEGRRVTHVAVKVRFASFYTPTREMKLRDGPTTDLDVIERAALTVLEKFRLDRPVRLLGVRTDLELDR
ncbi:DNA polymerase IV [Phytohabitans houttuyneae]|uniref:DNA polymerase IV n=1 Tax=Phytohabitans houttuyneae TaxID=1076126 RepID=A0A6V8K3M2_9ACTN|nr:DNA polymerase IV [Phytohabitans houttuyneae]GFJ76888.1 DNA polymerase IV [Phytohabitans houttuyneae]